MRWQVESHAAAVLHYRDPAETAGGGWAVLTPSTFCRFLLFCHTRALIRRQAFLRQNSHAHHFHHFRNSGHFCHPHYFCHFPFSPFLPFSPISAISAVSVVSVGVQGDRHLSGVSHVVVDEVHERTMQVRETQCETATWRLPHPYQHVCGVWATWGGRRGTFCSLF